MKNIIYVKVDLDHFWSSSDRIIGREGESETTQLQITLADELKGNWAYLDFKKPNGETFKTPRLEEINGVINYDIPLGVLDVKGEMGIQLVLQNENGLIWKSAIKHYANRSSINATEDIPDKEDFITEAQKILDDIQSGGGGSTGGGLTEDQVLELIANAIVDNEQIQALHEKDTELDEKLGDVENALDNIIAIQNTLIGGATE